MTLTEVLKLNEIIKAIKSDFFMITPNGIIGLDKTMRILTDIQWENNIGIYEFDKKMWDLFIKTLKEEKTERDDYTPWFNKICTKRFNQSPIMVQYNKLNEAYSLNTTRNSITIEDFQNTEWYATYSLLKADNGAILMKIDEQHIFYVMAGLIPANKGEKVSLVITDYYSYDKNGNEQLISFVVNFFINKKKLKLTVHRAIAYLALC